MTRINAALLILLMAIASQTVSNAHAVTFSDSSFFEPDWTPIIHVRDDPTVGGVTDQNSAANMTRRSGGGNPGAYYRSLIGIDFGDIVNTTGIYIDDTYDPREQAIVSLDYSYSVNNFDSNPASTTNVFPALLQDGRLFLGPGQSFSGNAWVSRSQSNLEASDFIAVDFWFTGQVIHPVFSAFGDPIQFGYSFQNNVVAGPGFVASRGMDNWSVTIDEAAMSDIHGDGVDAVDLAIWHAGAGITDDALLVDGDFDRDGDVDGSDFLKWQRQFGETSAISAVAVPEPSTVCVLAVCGILVSCGRYSKH